MKQAFVFLPFTVNIAVSASILWAVENTSEAISAPFAVGLQVVRGGKPSHSA